MKKTLHIICCLAVVITVAVASVSVAAVDDDHNNQLAAAHHLVAANIVLPAKSYRLDSPMRYSEVITMLERANGDAPVIERWTDWSGDTYSRLGGQYAVEALTDYSSIAEVSILEELLVKYKQGMEEPPAAANEAEMDNPEPVRSEESIRADIRHALQGTKENKITRGEFFEAFLDVM